MKTHDSVPDDPGVVGPVLHPCGEAIVLHLRVAQLQHAPGVAGVRVGQHGPVANIVQVLRPDQPPVPVLVVAVVPIVPVVVAAEVVAHLVQAGVVAGRAALLGRGEGVAVSRGHCVSVSAATVFKLIGQELGSVG